MLLPTPLPASMTPDPAASKLPFSAVRKSLRLLSDDAQESNDPEDITYVYSGFAPMSVRLVQCVAQKGGILVPPAGSEGKGKSAVAPGSAPTKVRAHPIVGWKGFEDVIASIPGETFDIVQKTNNSGDAGHPAPETTRESSPFARIRMIESAHRCLGLYRTHAGPDDYNCGVLLRRVYIYGDSCLEVGWEAEQR